MASEAQVLANRRNAEKSTGPCTAEGKAIVSQNAVKHGLLAGQAVIKGEDPGEFEFYRDQMLGELAPVGQMESVLAERVVSLSWRLQRAERLQGAAFDSLYEKHATDPFAKLTRSLRPKEAARGDPGAAEDDLALGRVVVKDFGYARVLDRLLMYERRIEHSLYRTMAELQRQRLLRELECATEKPTPERASAVRGVAVGGKHPFDKLRAGSRSPEEVGRGRPTLDRVEGRLYEEGSPTRKIAFGNPETPDGVTTNAPIAPAGLLASPHPALNGAGIPACRGSGTDSAKQSQSGADQFTANLFIYEGLREEGCSVPPQKQSQLACRGTPGTLLTAIS